MKVLKTHGTSAYHVRDKKNFATIYTPKINLGLNTKPKTSMNFFFKVPIPTKYMEKKFIATIYLPKISLTLDTKLATNIKVFEKYMVPIPTKYMENKHGCWHMPTKN
jgi:hypothetical protein